MRSLNRGVRANRRLGMKVGLGLVAAGALLSARPAEPCSICRCGDPTFNALGKEGYVASGWRFAADQERFDKQEGPLAQEGEQLVENRVTALASYGVSDRLTLYARLPFSFRSFDQIEEGSTRESFSTRGLSDPEVYGQIRFWGSGFSSGLGRRSSLSLVAGVKTALGQNDFRRDGVRVDEHAQPGTGSTDVFGGVSMLHLLDPRSAFFASLQYRHTGDNEFSYRYGRILLANLAYERKVRGRLDGVVELNYRFAGQDRDEVGELSNTGGSLLYLTPRLLVDMGHGVVLRGAIQVPIARSLNGTQKERAVFNAGLSYLFGGR
jgi:hypothetical protein